MIEAIEHNTLGEACDLLAKGFPARPRAYWEDALQRIDTLGENGALGLPVGQIMRAEGRAQGVALTIASRRPSETGTMVCLNFAAWYVEPDQRWRAPLMLRALARTPCDVLTDLTPSLAVQGLLPAFGFKPITQGFVLVLAGFHKGGGEIADLDIAATPMGELLRAHERFGAKAVMLHTRDGAQLPLLYRVVKFRGIRTAHVLYCGANQVLHDHLGALSRHLRRQAIGLVKLEAPVERTPPRGWLRTGREIRFARGPVSPDATDYLCSELSMFDW
jgi:hypothetical protein